MIKTNLNYRCGFTTGACAQAAAKGAARMLKSSEILESIEIELPNKERQSFQLYDQKISDSSAVCAVIKDSGDDKQDVTNGIKIYATLKYEKNGDIELIGGDGVGEVTKPGLSVSPGEPAINPVPRKMILRDVKAEMGEGGHYSITISVPDGERIAQDTYNPRLGIKGGISIIGTRGTVIPRSEKAYLDTIEMCLKALGGRAEKAVCLAAGTIGEDVLSNRFVVPEEKMITIGDNVGFAFDKCLKYGIKNIIYIGHIGKVSKVAAGLWNTHYSKGDARLETIAAYAAACGGDKELVNKILDLDLAEASIDLLRKEDLLLTFDRIALKARERAVNRCAAIRSIDIIILDLNGNIIGSTIKDHGDKDIWAKFQ